MIETIYFWQWLLTGLIFVILEILYRRNIFIVLGISAISCALIVSSYPMSLVAQFFLFFVITFSGYLFSHIVTRYFFTNKKPKEKREEWVSGFIGQNYILDKPIKNGSGSIMINKVKWKVQGVDMSIGTRVIIVDIKGVVLIAEKYYKK